MWRGCTYSNCPCRPFHHGGLSWSANYQLTNIIYFLNGLWDFSGKLYHLVDYHVPKFRCFQMKFRFYLGVIRLMIYFTAFRVEDDCDSLSFLWEISPRNSSILSFHIGEKRKKYRVENPRGHLRALRLNLLPSRPLCAPRWIARRWYPKRGGNIRKPVVQRELRQGKVAEGRGAHGMISDVSAALRVSPASQWSRAAGGARGEQVQT